MNGSFNAFQMTQKPEITSYRKHIRLKKSMNLPDDTLEYWGFYLLKGATVALSVCSRFPGSSILVVKGERNLRTCGMLDHNKNKEHAQGIFLPNANRQVKITFETNAQEINSEEMLAEIKKGETLMKEEIQNIMDPTTTKELTQKSADMINSTYNVSDIATDGNTTVASEMDEKDLKTLLQVVETYVQKHTRGHDIKRGNSTRKLRHSKRKHKIQTEEERRNSPKNDSLQEVKGTHEKDTENIRNKISHGNVDTKKSRIGSIRKLKEELHSKDMNNMNIENEDEAQKNAEIVKSRLKRNQEIVNPPSILDQGIRHGGNAGKNMTEDEDESSVSSFENGLFNCYGGAILLAQEFEPSDQCVNVSYLVSGKHMQTRHNVIEDGYYYYIFYSDNDFVSNDIHALFDIYKPTFQYENVTKSCINQTECSFSLSLMSADRVIVEIPTRDGIEHEVDDVNLLISICHPRMGTYIIFPIAVLLFILSCAFM